MSQTLELAVHAFQPMLPLAIGYSGGADSTALLVACARKWPGMVRAIHVNHGLQTAADDFERHCEAVCRGLGVELTICRVNAHPAKGQSPEAAARDARYAAFAEVVAQVSREQDASLLIRTLALAHHADDQMETLLIALGRGAGLAGLSGMARVWHRDGVNYARPLLSVSLLQIRNWLAEQGVPHIDDPTNALDRYTRNRIRHRLMPALRDLFPHAGETFARSAAHAAQADDLLTEFAQEDLSKIGRPPAIVRLQGLSLARQANVLRYWLKDRYKVIPSTAQLEELIRQVSVCRTKGHHIRLKVGSGYVLREGETLAWYNL